MTANTKSVVLGLLLFAIAVTSAAHLIMRGPPPEGEIILQASEPALVKGADAPKTGKHPRVDWAAEFQGKMRARNYAVQVSTAGPDHRVFQMRWPRDISPDDREHMQQLQTRSMPFYERLGRLGFSRVEMFLGRSVVWSRNL